MSSMSYLIQIAEEQGGFVEKQKQEDAQLAKAAREEADREAKAKAKLIVEQRDADEIRKEQELFQTLLDHREIIDLHGLNVHNAKTIVGSKARCVARSGQMMCVGFVHGKGNHSGESFLLENLNNDSIFNEEFDYMFEPKLKPIIRKYLDDLAIQLNCKSIYGENMFVMGGFRSDSISDELSSGIVFFMNEKYFDFFNNEFNYYWHYEDVIAFQRISN